MSIIITSDDLRTLLCLGLYAFPTVGTIVLLISYHQWTLVGGLILSMSLHIHQAATCTRRSCSALRTIQYGFLRCISPLLVACLVGLFVFSTNEGKLPNCKLAVSSTTDPVSNSNQQKPFEFAKCLLLSQILASFPNPRVSRCSIKNYAHWVASMVFSLQVCCCVGLGWTAWITLLLHDLSHLSMVLCLTRKYSNAHLGSSLSSGYDHNADAKDTTMVDNMYVIADAVTMQLTSYEIGLVRDIWLVLLYILAINMTKVFSSDQSSTTTVGTYYLYSHSQCFGVVLVFVTAMLLIILGTELIVHIFSYLSTITIQDEKEPILRVGIIKRLQSQLGLRLAVFFTVTGIVTVTGIQPQLQYIYEISWFPLWIWGILHRSPGFIELNLCIYWIFWIFGSVLLGFYASQRWGWPRTCNRKIFHFVVVGMFIHCLHHPTAYYGDTQIQIGEDMPDIVTEAQAAASGSIPNSLSSGVAVTSSYLDRRRSFLVLSLGAALCIFILIEYIRLFLLVHPRTHTVRSTVDSYMALFQSQPQMQQMQQHPPLLTDHAASELPRVELSHISLLVGIASTIWMAETVNYGDTTKSENSEVECDLLYYQLPYIGLLVLGVGDAVAACTGRLLFDGRTPKWLDFAPMYVHIPVVNDDALCSRSLSTTSSDRRPVKNQRTYAGSIAFFLSVIVGMWLLCHPVSHPSPADSRGAYFTTVLPGQSWPAVGVPTSSTPSLLTLSSSNAVAVAILCILLVTIVEALTCENDNFLLPLYASILHIWIFIVDSDVV